MTASPILNGIVTAIARWDGPAVGTALDEAEASFGVTGCVDEVLLPAMALVQEQAATGQLEPAQQRMATEAARAWLNWRSAFVVPQRFGEPILLAGGPRDRDVVVLEALALVLRTRGFQTRLLGGRIRTENLVIAARASAPAAVVVLGETRTGRSQAAASVLAVDQLGYSVFFLGSALAAEHARLPGQFLGDTVAHAAERIIGALTS